MGFPVVVAGALLPALVVSEVTESITGTVENIGNVMTNQFQENYMIKRLAVELSRNYTTDTKNINGSIIPEGISRERLDQIERLIQATLNQNKFR